MTIFGTVKVNANKWLILNRSILVRIFGTTDFRIIYFRWREGVPTSVLGSQPIIWLLSSSPWSGDSLGVLDVTPYPILYPSGHQVQTSVFPLWPGFATLGIDPHYYGVLTVILWWLANSNTRIVVILFLSSQWDTTWHYCLYITTKRNCTNT